MGRSLRALHPTAYLEDEMTYRIAINGFGRIGRNYVALGAIG
jgi:hypothetical protein